MIFDQLVQAISLYLVERPVETVEILDFIVKKCFKERLWLPRCLHVGKSTPLNEIELVHIAFAFNKFFNFLLA